jgi:hypothetical protein
MLKIMKKEVKEMVVKNEVVKFEFVDLGLSVKWANMNMGAKSSIENGLYFAWNEVKLDDEGRLPSESEMMELIEKCTWEWVSKDGKLGYNVRSRINNNEIFLPAAGLICGEKEYFVGEMGYYLTNTMKESRGACELIMSPKYYGMYLAGLYKRSVRLVK